MTQIKTQYDICQYNIVLLHLSTMRHLMLICSMLLLFLASHAQENEFIEEPKYVLKFAPRLFSPRITYEKIINSRHTVGLDTRLHLNIQWSIYYLYFPPALRFEGFYRVYFNETAPFGAYFQSKAALGYFDYAFYGNKTKGMQAGTGFTFGGQFKMGKKKGVVDIFAGIQVVAPIFIDLDLPNNRNRNSYVHEYKLIHYTTIAFPLELGIRFGFMKTKKVPKSYSITPSNDY